MTASYGRWTLPSSCAYQVKDCFCDTFAGRVISIRPTLKECADGNVNVSTTRGGATCITQRLRPSFKFYRPGVHPFGQA